MNYKVISDPGGNGRQNPASPQAWREHWADYCFAYKFCSNKMVFKGAVFTQLWPLREHKRFEKGFGPSCYAPRLLPSASRAQQRCFDFFRASWRKTSKGLGLEPWIQENAYFLYNPALRKSTVHLTKLTLSCHFFASDFSFLLLIVRFFSLVLLFFGFLEMCLGVRFFLFILLGLCCSPLSMHLCLSWGLESSLQILFLLHYSLLSFWDSVRFLLR